MSATLIQRQFNQVIAAHYDLDPQSVISDTLDRALSQVQSAFSLDAGVTPLVALDVGMGTGLFYEKLRGVSARELRPYGLDISQAMIDIARCRIPDLVAEVDDGARLNRH